MIDAHSRLHAAATRRFGSKSEPALDLRSLPRPTAPRSELTQSTPTPATNPALGYLSSGSLRRVLNIHSLLRVLSAKVHVPAIELLIGRSTTPTNPLLSHSMGQVRCISILCLYLYLSMSKYLYVCSCL